MFKFSEQSQRRLLECHPSLQKVFNRVIQHVDCSIIYGYRDKEAQDEAYRTGKSKLKWPESKHNVTPSRAIDVAPFPVDWSDTKRFYYFSGFVMGIASDFGIAIRYGGDWNGNFVTKDENFFDLVHFELKV